MSHTLYKISVTTFLLYFLTFPSFLSSFYLPGVAPRQFPNGADVGMCVNKVTSVHTQLPFKYYSLPVCVPDKLTDKAENLGEVLSGDRIENSLYTLRMKLDKQCEILCVKKYGSKEIKYWQKMIKDEYRVHWLIDNLPAAMKIVDVMDPKMEYYESTFPLGVRFNAKDGKDEKDDTYFLYNHIRFTLLYHENPDRFEGARVVGFFVEPFTVKHTFDASKNLATCNEKKGVSHQSVPLELKVDGEKEIEVVWTYDVSWQPSDIPWASRWDVFLKSAQTPDRQIHWFSIINSLMIVMFLTGMVAMIMMRTLHKDITRYNQLDLLSAEANESADLLDLDDAETGWKLLHGDVFRPPSNRNLLSVLLGSGVQILLMIILTIIFACLGFLSPANRGGLGTSLLLLFVLMSYFGGNVSAKMYKMFGGKQWKRNTIMTAMIYPGIVFGMFFIVDLFVWNQGSSGAVPIGTLFALLVLWFGISFPLSSIGAYHGFTKPAISNPCRYNHIPRQIPPQPIYMNAFVSALVGGILPFGAVFIELFFIMSSMWLHQIYYVFGFLLIVLLILIVTCAEITVVMCYFQLCSEDYNWWWRSFLTSGSSALYLFAYSILYFVTKLDMTKFTAGLLYFVYMFIISFSFFLMTGMIGFFACFWFVRRIYSAIKVD